MVQSEEVLADVMKRHGVEWSAWKKREHLSVLDYKKEQRTKEIAELESKLADKKTNFKCTKIVSAITARASK